jgi:polysaccharide biosynthesis transport protein
MGAASSGGPTTLADYLAILRRRVWVIVIPLVLAPTLAAILTSAQKPVYEASAKILVKRADIAAAVAGVADPTLQVDPVRFLQTQASIARDPQVAQRAVSASGVSGVSAATLLGSSSVTPETDADVLDVKVSFGKPEIAARLANAYALQFTKFRTELDTGRVNDALRSVRSQINSLRGHGVSINSPAYGTLLESRTRLETLGKLLANNTQVLQPAEGAAKTRPKPAQKAIIGLLLGGVLGLGLAFLGEALDRRVRSEEEIGSILGLPLLGRVPKPPRRLRKANELVMLAEPRSIAAEPVRALRTSIDFLNLERNARTIMVTSSIQREGKSTTIANLAVALARAGRRVVLVDLDLRRPFVNRFFGLRPAPGITDVLLGRLSTSEALRAVPVPTSVPARSGPALRVDTNARSSNGHGQVEGVLHVLPAGTIPPDPGELIEGEALSRVLESLRAQFDVVLIDTAPLLVVGDALTLSSKVDAMFLITRLKLVHRGMLHELARLLEACPAEKLGYVVASAELSEAYGYGYGYGYPVLEAERSEKERVP